MSDLLLATELNDDDVDNARTTIARHRRQRYPHRRACTWCHQEYPCTRRQTAEAVLRATGHWHERPVNAPIW